MFNILPEKIAVKALHEILKISMDTLTVRYCQLEPAAKRLTQYRDACNARPTKKFHAPPLIEQCKTSCWDAISIKQLLQPQSLTLFQLGFSM